MKIRDRFKRQPAAPATQPDLAPGQHMVTFEGVGMH